MDHSSDRRKHEPPTKVFKSRTSGEKNERGREQK